MSMFLRPIVLGPTLLILLLGVGYPIFWFVVAGQVEDGFLRWRDARNQRGYIVEHGALTVGGFPSSIRLTIATPAIASTKDGWSIKSSQADFEIQPWNWRRYRVEASGPHRLVGVVQGRPVHVAAETDSAWFIGHLNDRGRMAEGVVDIRDLRVRASDGGQMSATKHLQAQLRWPDDAAQAGPSSFELTVHASETQLATKIGGPLGTDLRTFRLSGTLNGKPPGKIQRDALDAWRQDGGTVDIRRVVLGWGALDVSGNGTLALDAALRPLGAFTTEIQGHRALLAALEQTGKLRRRDASAARLALDLLSKPSGNGDGRRVVTVPLTAQRGRLYLGPVRLLKLPPILPPVPSG